MASDTPNSGPHTAQPDKQQNPETAGMAADQSVGAAAPGERNNSKHSKKRKHTEWRKGSGQFQKKRRTRDDWDAKPKPSTSAGDGKDSPFQSRMSIPFSAEEIAAEERQPKKKVAMLIGYAGTGYHGMQINHDEKTIEGDIFAALVKAGAISKANADDPKKSAFVRCARTDKGVHAAGNVMSLKLSVGEDGRVVQRINEQLPDQIRIWGLVQTNRQFNCWQACDSRWYEFLLPTYSLLPPHPESYLGQQLVETAKSNGTYEERMERLDDVSTFWEDVQKNEIEPVLSQLDPSFQEEVRSRLHAAAELKSLDDLEHKRKSEPAKPASHDASNPEATGQEALTSIEHAALDAGAEGAAGTPLSDPATSDVEVNQASEVEVGQRKPMTPADEAVRKIKAIYVAAKRRYRITPARLQRLQDALDMYKGTHNFHNYTVYKSFKDPSAQRHIKSFIANPEPVQIRDTEWVSLKVHGQSFMMHQIRKMVAMACLVARCGAPTDLITESYNERRISVPKAPGLGLLLERPVFDAYNTRATTTFEKKPIDFDKYEDIMQKFKDEEIYARMFDVEEREAVFYQFFHQVDSFRKDHFLWAVGANMANLSERNGPADPKALEEIEGEEEEEEETNPADAEG